MSPSSPGPRSDPGPNSAVPDKPSAASRRNGLGFLAAALLVLALGAWAFLGQGRRPAPAPQKQAAQEAELRAAVRAAPGQVEPWLGLVGFLLDSRRGNDALDAAREAAAAHPGTPAVQRALADALAATGRVTEAEAALRPVRGDTGATIARAGYLVRLGRREEARQLVDGLGALSGAEAIRAAQVLLDAFDPQGAVRLLRAQQAASTQDLDLRTTLGLALLLAGQYVESARMLEPAVGQAPDVPVLHYYLGSALRLSGAGDRLPDAETHLRRAAELVPSDALFQYELALARVQLRDLEGARGPLEQAAQLKPDLPEAQRDLSRLNARAGAAVPSAIAQSRYLRLVGDAAAAVKQLLPLAARHPHDLDLHLELAEAHYDALQTPRMLELLAKLAAKHPEDPRVLAAWYRGSRAGDQNLVALKALDALQKVEPEQVRWQEERADLYLRLGRETEIEPICRELTRREPGSARYHFQVAEAAWRWSGHADKGAVAEPSLREAIRLQPDHAQSHYLLGQVLQSAGRHEEAVSHLRRALDLSPSTADAHRLLGRAYTQLRQPERAREALALYRRYQAQDDEQRRLEVPSSVHRATPAEQHRLAAFYIRVNRLDSAAVELESLARRHPEDRKARELLVALYGHGRRFQRHFEEREWLAGRGRGGQR